MKSQNLKKKIIQSINKFNLDLNNKTVLTEAATGNYVVTPVIAAVAGADVIAFTRDSRYGSVKDVLCQTEQLSNVFHVKDKIKITTDLNHIPLDSIDVLTNTGFLRPINAELIDRLSSCCVIPLMYEPWEFRKEDLDLDACAKKGIKVYGTDENDPRLKTMDYIGYIILYFLLNEKISPLSQPHILLLGNKRFIEPVYNILKNNGYTVKKIDDYNSPLKDDVRLFDVIILLEHKRDSLLIGDESAFISSDSINPETLLIHIAGNVSIKGTHYKCIPDNPALFGNMSFTCDYIDSTAVIDLHTAGLKVAEGMIRANELALESVDYKKFMTRNYPSIAFPNKKYW